jgi:small subunit ribosomal protein S5
VKDVLSKSLGSKNAANVVKATLDALLSLRLREHIYQGRGLEIKKVEAPKPPGMTPPPPPLEPPPPPAS